MPFQLAACLKRPILPSAITQSSAILPFLLPALYTSIRPASVLSDLRSNPGAIRRRRRVGRGPSSGKGKTSGRGQKGQKARGKVPYGFEGGQTTAAVAAGTHGFKNNLAAELTTLNLAKLSSWITQSRIDPTRPITIKELAESRCVSRVKDGVKLLAKGSETLSHPINVVISRASGNAIAAIEAAGGSVMTRYYTPFAIRQIIKGRMDPIQSLRSQPETIQALRSSQTLSSPQLSASASASEPSTPSSSLSPTSIQTYQNKYRYRLPDATSRKDMEYYRDPAHRGYLSYMVPEGEGPSLFFKAPGMVRKKDGKGGSSTATMTTTKKIKSANTVNAALNKLW